MKVLVTERLSEHKSKTPEGYLVCMDCILARTGKQDYRRGELFPDAENPEEIISVDRKAEQVFSPTTLASFENKPLTCEHPEDDVTPENYKMLSVGFVRDIRKGTADGQPVMIGNIIVTDPQCIDDIENGIRTDLSCGYNCDITEDEHPQQINIRGNHIALCEQGRAGIAKIIDSADKIKTPETDYNIEKKNNKFCVNFDGHEECFDTEEEARGFAADQIEKAECMIRDTAIRLKMTDAYEKIINSENGRDITEGEKNIFSHRLRLAIEEAKNSIEDEDVPDETYAHRKALQAKRRALEHLNEKLRPDIY